MHARSTYIYTRLYTGGGECREKERTAGGWPPPPPPRCKEVRRSERALRVYIKDGTCGVLTSERWSVAPLSHSLARPGALPWLAAKTRGEREGEEVRAETERDYTGVCSSVRALPWRDRGEREREKGENKTKREHC